MEYIGCIFACFVLIVILWFIFFPLQRDRWIATGSTNIWKLLLCLFFVVCIPVTLELIHHKYIENESDSAISYSVPIVTFFSQYGRDYDSENTDSIAFVSSEKLENIAKSDEYTISIKQHKPVNISVTDELWNLLIVIIAFVVLNGFFVPIIINTLNQRITSWHKGLIHYGAWRFVRWKRFVYGKSCHCFVVVIGGHSIAPYLIKQIFDRYKKLNEYPFVLIQTSGDVELLRKKIRSVVGDDWKHVVIYWGGCESMDDIKKLHVEHAEEIIVLGEDFGKSNGVSYHDSKCMKCVSLVSNVVDRRKLSNRGVMSGDRLSCRVMFEYQTTFSVLQRTQNIKNIPISHKLDFRPFNYYESWAHQVLVQNTFVSSYDNMYLPLDGVSGIQCTSDKHIHLIIVGMSRMGVAMGTVAAFLAHYPNFVMNPDKCRSRITFIDKNASEESALFRSRYRELFQVSRWRYIEASANNFSYTPQIDDTWTKPAYGAYLGKEIVDIDWEFIQGGVESEAIQKYILDVSKDNKVLLTIAVCFPAMNQSLASAMYLPTQVYSSGNLNQILVYQLNNDSIIKKFFTPIKGDNKTLPLYEDKIKVGANKAETKQIILPLYGDKIKAFGMIDSLLSIETTSIIEELAQILADTYDNNTTCKDLARKGEVYAIYFWSNIYCACVMLSKMRSVGYKRGDSKDKFSKEELDCLYKSEHYRWNVERLLNGTRVATEEEQTHIIELLRNASNNQETVKKEIKQLRENGCYHHLICSLQRVLEIDDSLKYDMLLTDCAFEHLDEIIKKYCKL